MNPTQMAHEHVLVLRCQAGDHDAFAGLFERYQAPLKYYLRRLLDSPELADDVLQTVWLKVLRGVKRLRRPDAFRTWLYRIARNEAFQQLRRDRRWIEVQESLPAQEQEEDEEEEEPPAADAARIHAALGQLSSPHRDVLMLRFLEDLSYVEIAEIVNSSVGTVRSRLHYAKAAMKRILEE